MIDYKINVHSSIRVEDEGIVMYFDPFEIKSKSADANYIFITHEHYDHFDSISIKNVMKENTKIICPKNFSEKVISELGNGCVDNIIFVSANETIQLINNVTFQTFHSYNVGKNFHPYDYGMLSYLVDFFGTKIYIPGDTDINDEIKNIRCDILFVPIGGTYTMDYREAAEITNEIMPKVVVPMHYGSIVGDKCLGEKFAKLINKNVKVNLLI